MVAMAKKGREPAQRRQVDFVRNDDDMDVVIMGLLGWTTDAIALHTGLTQSQIIYRLGLVRVKRSDYRQGTSNVAEFVLTQFRENRQFHKGIAEDAVAKVRGASLHRSTLSYRGVLKPEVTTPKSTHAGTGG